MSDYTEATNYMLLAADSGDTWMKDRALRRGSEEITTLRQQLTTAQAEIEALRGRVQYLEASIKNAIGWIDGDLRDIIRDVGNQICSYNDLYESADRIEQLLAEALRQQAAESEGGEDAL